MSDTDRESRVNRLIDETSPYLLQHAHNPVDWYPWGDEALNRAREEERLILLSIGYSACHWCHVMERESFENERIAKLMNDNFVCVKVDREERPDIDDVYMSATLAMNNGQGGWPMTVFITPDLQPVFAGTYFPPDDVPGRPGFTRILSGIAEAWEKDRGSVVEGANQFAEHLRSQREIATPLEIKRDDLQFAVAQFGDAFDREWGGFGQAPKFPAATGLAFLLRTYVRERDPFVLSMITRSLDAMAAGGIYDHVGGGFARYSTDREWLAPHFEKMLYDNALLAKTYLEAFQVTGNDEYRRVATETLDYVARDMTSDEGGFFSSTDADSEGVEGKFFVWTPAEVDAAMDETAATVFKTYYDITDSGNWEGVSIPRVLRPAEEVAASLSLSEPEFAGALSAARTAAFDARSARVHPGLDDKILTSWNGMMISAFAYGHLVLGDTRYLNAAGRAADFILGKLKSDNGLLRTYRNGQAHIDAFLEDYAYFAEALVDLYESGGERSYLDEARNLANGMLELFRDTSGGHFYSTSDRHDALPVRYHEGGDGAVPSANAVAASALLRLSRHFDDSGMRDAALASLEAYGSAIRRYPRAFARSLIVADTLMEEPVEIAIVGKHDGEDTRSLRKALGGRFIANRIVAHLDPASGDSDLPLLSGKTPVDGHAAVYVCRNYACRAPITDPAELDTALGEDTSA